MSRVPPAAGWPVSADPWAQAAAALLWGLAGAACVLALGPLLDLADAFHGAALVILSALVAVASATLAWRGSRQRPGQLSWTGATWQWRADGGPVQGLEAPQVMLDLDGWLLLRCRDSGSRRTRWWTLRRADRGEGAGPGAWASFRAAVYSPATRTDSRARRQGDASP